jgi:uncharacterized protein YgiM (DUF1202 family)
MIRRTLKSGLLATVAVLAFLPTAAGATAASATTQHPVPSAVTQYDAHHRGHVMHRFHHRTHLRRHHARRVHRLTPRGAVYRSVPRTTTYLLTLHAAPYRLQYRLVAQWVPYGQVRSATGRVTTRHARLNVRSGPGTGYRVIGHRHTGRHVALLCKTRGSSVHGNHTWYRLSHHRGYVSARYIRANRVLPWC